MPWLRLRITVVIIIYTLAAVVAPTTESGAPDGGATGAPQGVYTFSVEAMMANSSQPGPVATALHPYSTSEG